MVRPGQYPRAVREEALRLYAEGDTLTDAAEKVGTSHSSLQRWVKMAGISRSKSEAAKLSPRVKAHLEIHGLHTGRWNGSEEHKRLLQKLAKRRRGIPLSAEVRQKISESRKLKILTSHDGSHKRASKEITIEGTCELCRERKATDRMRIDDCYFPYHRDLVVLACHSCNLKHAYGSVSITFLNPHDGEWYAMASERVVTKEMVSVGCDSDGQTFK